MSADLLAGLVRDAVIAGEQATAIGTPPTDPAVLAAELRRRGWLTDYQAEAITHGHAARLRLGSYVLLEPLGEGGMGQVFKARNRLGRVVALKVIRPALLADPEAVRRFEREVRAAARLEHPNVVRALDAEVSAGVHFFAMEYLDGKDLARLVRQYGPMPPGRAADAVRQAALGLQHAHERGMVHRDIKPANLLLTNDGVVKVMDLGLARSVAGGVAVEGLSTVTPTGSVMGTPDFMSPEQVQDAKAVDIRSDLYSLGCTLYFLLAGRVPFPREQAIQKLLAHLGEEPDPLESLRPEVPPRLVAVVRRLMAKDPHLRHPTPAALAADLSDPALLTGGAPDAPTEAISAGWSGVVAVPPAPVPAAARHEAGRLWWWALVAGMGLCLAGAGVIGYALWPRREGPVIADPGREVRADAGWQDAGLDVAGGETVSARSSGRWGVPGVAGGCGPEGRAEAPRDRAVLESEPAGCLLGRFGAGEPFALTAGKKVRAPAGGGRLFLRANSLDPGDGSIRVAVDGGRPGQPAPPPPPTRAEAADAAYAGLTLGADEAGRLRAFLREFAGTPAAGRALARLRKLAAGRSPLDALGANALPQSVRRFGPPEGVVAVYGSGPVGQNDTQVPIGGVAVSPTGGLVACASACNVRVRDARTLEVRHFLGGHEGPVDAVVFATDSTVLAADRAGVRVWDLTADPPHLASTLREKEPPACLAISPDRRWLALGTHGSNELAIWDLSASPPKRTGGWKGAEGALTAVAWHPSEALVAGGGSDGIVRLWTIKDGEPAEVASDKTAGLVEDIAFADDRTLLAACRNNLLRWTVASERLTAEPAVEGVGPTLAVGAGGVVFAGSFGVVNRLDLAARPLGRTEFSPESARPGGVVVTGLAVSPDRKLLYTGDSDGMLRAWEVTRDPPAEREVSRGPAVALEVLAFAPDGKTLLAGPYDHELHLFDATDPMAAPLVIRADPADGRPLRAAFGPDGRTVAVAHVRPEGACLCLWELTTPPRVRSRLAVEARPWSVAWSDDGRYLAVGLVGGAAVVWDVAGSEPKSVADLIGEVVAFAPGGRLLAGGKAGEGVRLHDLSTLPPRAGADFKANFRGMAFSADGRTLFVGEPLGRGLAFDVASPARERKTFNRSGGDVVALMPGAASFDLVTGDDAGQLFAWRGTDPAGSWRLPCPVRAWAAAPDGRHVAGAACDGRVYLFRIAPAP